MRKVYLVGAGPGDPELLTSKAQRVLRMVDVVLYDRLVSPEVLSVANPRAELIYVGKHEGEQESTQGLIFRLMLDRARQGKAVARLKGGDACVFGRAAEEWLLLARNGIEVEIVPGVSSALAAPALAGVPLTYRGVSRGFAVIGGHCAGGDSVDWRDYTHVDTLVILMAVKERANIARALIRAGRSQNEPAIFIERSSTPAERVIDTTLGSVADGVVEVESPAVFVIGSVVAVRAELGERMPAAVGRPGSPKVSDSLGPLLDQPQANPFESVALFVAPAPAPHQLISPHCHANELSLQQHTGGQATSSCLISGTL